MNLRRQTISAIALFAMLVAVYGRPAAAQTVRVQATVNSTTIGTEERVVYALEIEGADMGSVRTPEAPSAENLTLDQAIPSTSRSVSIINGQMSQSVTFRWSYRPRDTGPATINAATVRVGDRSYTTESIRLNVVPQSQRPQQAPSAQRAPGWPFGQTNPSQRQREPVEISEQDLFIRAVPSHTSAFTNQQVVIEYQLYGRDYIQLRQSRLTDSWDAEGFWREELEVDTRPIPRPVVENGLRYNVIVLKRVAVFPTRAGTLRIDPLQIETEVYVPGRAADPFSAFFPSTSFQPVKLSSPPVTIDVRPLPTGAPPEFAGAVGSYSLDARLDAREAAVGESVQLTLSISGTGNIATLAPPAFEAPGIFDQYDPQIVTDVDRSGRVIRGRKTVTHVLVPRSNGTVEMPEIPFVYFDPGAREYRRLVASSGALRISGTAGPVAAGTTRGGLPVDDIAGIRSGEVSWHRLDRAPLHRNPLPYVAIVLPMLAVAGAVVHRRRTSRLAADPRYARSRRAHPLARKHLREAEALLSRDESRAFYAEVERALLAFIGNRLDIPETGLTRLQLDARLRENGVDESLRQELYRLLDEAEQAQYAPVPPERAAMETAIDRASRVIVAISEADKRRVRAEAG